jgi:hypothetical protein
MECYILYPYLNPEQTKTAALIAAAIVGKKHGLASIPQDVIANIEGRAQSDSTKRRRETARKGCYDCEVEKVNLREKFSLFPDHWKLRVVGEARLGLTSTNGRSILVHALSVIRRRIVCNHQHKFTKGRGDIVASFRVLRSQRHEDCGSRVPRESLKIRILVDSSGDN